MNGNGSTLKHFGTYVRHTISWMWVKGTIPKKYLAFHKFTPHFSSVYHLVWVQANCPFFVRCGMHSISNFSRHRLSYWFADKRFQQNQYCVCSNIVTEALANESFWLTASKPKQMKRSTSALLWTGCNHLDLNTSSHAFSTLVIGKCLRSILVWFWFFS